jgi:hypothetical protein
MAAGVRFKLKGKTSAFAGGELQAREFGVDTVNDKVYFSTDGSTVRALDNQAAASVADQVVNAASTALITGSVISMPATKLKIGSIIRWRLALSKTAAGSAARSIIVQCGTNGTTADADVITFTMPVGTAAVDKGWLEVTVICRGPLSSSGILCGNLTMIHNLSATGLAAIPSVVMQANSGNVDVTVANLKLSLVLTTGASEVITIQQVIADTMNL